MSVPNDSFWPAKLGDWFDVVSKAILIVGAIIGAGWAYFEYLDRRQEARVGRTIEYVRRFSDEHLQGAQERLGLAWYAVRNRLRLLATTPVRSASEFEARKRQLVMSIIERTGSVALSVAP